MIRYLLVMAMIILTPPKGSGGMPLAPKPAVIEARVWDRLAAALSPVGGIGEIRMRANPRKIVAYKDFAKQMVMAQYE